MEFRFFTFLKFWIKLYIVKLIYWVITDNDFWKSILKWSVFFRVSNLKDVEGDEVSFNDA